MNSDERKIIRRIRREAKRKEKAAKIQNTPYDEVFNFRNLYKSGLLCCKNVRWKDSVKIFEFWLLQYVTEAMHYVHSKQLFPFKGFNSFHILERGKKRDIDALHITDRMLQKCMCNFILKNAMTRSFIYDNAASLENKGMDFCLKRMRKHLRHHFNKYGTEGGIYQFDLKSYFLTIPHKIIKERIRKVIKDHHLCKQLEEWVDDFKHMKNYEADEENPHGIGLGSEISQLIALDYGSMIDHFIKDICRIKGYGRYMDDGYIISNDLNELKEIKEKLYKFVESIGLKMSDKKNKITPFKHHSFTFLKFRFRLLETGKITQKLNKKSTKGIIHKLKTYKKWVDDPCINFTIFDAYQSYQSWRSHIERGNNYKSLINLDHVFANTFNDYLETFYLGLKLSIKANKKDDKWKYHGYRNK